MRDMKSIEFPPIDGNDGVCEGLESCNSHTQFEETCKDCYILNEIWFCSNCGDLNRFEFTTKIGVNKSGKQSGGIRKIKTLRFCKVCCDTYKFC